ncbi:MAG: 1-acyl-sn-glycerol-3-phosphate acyltransferase [Saccharospirillaceae bacterium]|nr:1-acyl-sn-glycerol-3-phosphate acyltransferase [Pseudomonadales bacterium]NRB79854.1 1-acyl-sn-glycerol-3-phosphate acyltransferase [Saccharospirillaceae bacterium]
MSQFDDIRPYTDAEVRGVLSKFVQDSDMHNAVAKFKLPTIHRFAPKIARWMIASYLKRKTKTFNSVSDLQLMIEGYMDRMIATTTDDFTSSGLDTLDLDKATLFISNHRDIVLDPALVNLALHRAGSNTLTIATGDNLFTKPWVSDLMRLNKSFIVKRSAATKREHFKNAKQLSAYMDYCVHEEKNHVWIAQREGRAKDGLDKTNPAIISMLLLNKAKSTDLSEFINVYNLVPVSISYEYDPCDVSKAIELDAIKQHGEYKKGDQEDIQSITKGIVGHKGKVHVAFGSPLKGNFADNIAVANSIDEQIISNYHLFESNIKAASAIQQNKALEHDQLTLRMADLTDSQKSIFIQTYANPVLAKK